MWTGVCQKCSCEPSHKKNPSMEGQPSHLIQSSASSICLMHMIHDLPWLAMAYILQLLSSGIPEAGNTSSVTFNIKTRLKVLQQCLSHVVRNQAHLQSVRLKYSMYPHPPPKKKKEYFPFLFIPRGFLINSPSYRILGEEVQQSDTTGWDGHHYRRGRCHGGTTGSCFASAAVQHGTLAQDGFGAHFIQDLCFLLLPWMTCTEVIWWPTSL